MGRAATRELVTVSVEGPNVTALLAKAHRGARRALVGRLRPHGLTPQQYWVLEHARPAAGLSLGQLGRLLQLDAPSASRAVSALVLKGLALARSDTGDRRVLRLSLTSRGQQLIQKLAGVEKEVEAALTKGLGAAELGTLTRLLARLVANSNARS